MNAIATSFSVSFAIIEAITPVMTTVIGPVVSEIIRVCVTPNNAANKPIITAPYTPDIGLIPEATLNNS